MEKEQKNQSPLHKWYNFSQNLAVVIHHLEHDKVGDTDSFFKDTQTGYPIFLYFFYWKS